MPYPRYSVRSFGGAQSRRERTARRMAVLYGASPRMSIAKPLSRLFVSQPNRLWRRLTAFLSASMVGDWPRSMRWVLFLWKRLFVESRPSPPQNMSRPFLKTSPSRYSLGRDSRLAANPFPLRSPSPLVPLWSGISTMKKPGRPVADRAYLQPFFAFRTNHPDPRAWA